MRLVNGPEQYRRNETPISWNVQGLKGDQGDAGMVGMDGRDGIDGMDGAPGPRGFSGPEGPQGPEGPEGPVGPGGGALHVFDALGTDVGLLVSLDIGFSDPNLVV